MKFYSELEKKISLYGYVFTLFNFVGFAVILVLSPPVFARLTREDAFTEYSGCAFLFLSAALLFAVAVLFFQKKPAGYIKYGLLFLSASIAFLWGAGEEISWGQRIFDFQSPEVFQNKNIQREFNLHNFNTSFFNKSLRNINLLMIVVPAFLLYKNIRTLIGIPVPNILLIFSLQVSLGYSTYLHIDLHDVVSIVCLCLWIVYFHGRKDKLNMGLAALTLVSIIVVGTINYFMHELVATNAPREIREYTFSFICLLYAANIFLYFRRELSVSGKA